MSAVRAAGAASAAPSAALHTEFEFGSIKKIELGNFMTHQKTVMYPSAGVNFLLGANGSGKSSIVCAICLGLGGKTGDMERGSNLASFIMTGKTSAFVELTLAGSTETGGDVVVRRELTRKSRAAADDDDDEDDGGGRGKGGRAGAGAVVARDNVTSTWKVNGADASAKDTERYLRERFHVQMDNLCMFLPQERVGTFSTLSSRDLLASTLASVDPKLNGQYASLVELQSSLAKHAQEIGVKEKAIGEQREQFVRLDKQKKKFQAYADLEKTIFLLTHRLVFAQRKEAEDEVVALEKAWVEINDQGKRFEAEATDMRARMLKVRAAKEDAEKALAQKTALHRASAEALSRDATRYREWCAEVEASMRQLDLARGAHTERQRKVDEAQKMLDVLTTRYKKLAAGAPGGRSLEELQAVSRELGKQRSALQARVMGYENDLQQYTSQLSRYTPQRERLAREHRQLADPWELRVAAFKRNTFRTANISMQLFDQLPGLIAEKRVHARTRGPIGLHLQVAKDRIPLAHHDDAARLIAGGIKPNTFYGFVAPDGKTSRALNEWTTAPGSKEGVSVFEVSPDTPRPVIDRKMTPSEIDAFLTRIGGGGSSSSSSSSSSAAGGAATGGAGTGGRAGVRGGGSMYACWFDELMTADGDIMEAVAKRGGYEMGDNLVIFGDRVNERIAALCSRWDALGVPEGVALVTAEATFRVKRSAYGGAPTTMRVKNHSLDLLLQPDTTDRKAALEAEIGRLDATIGKLQADAGAVAADADSVRREADAVSAQLAQINTYRATLTKASTEVASAERQHQEAVEALNAGVDAQRAMLKKAVTRLRKAELGQVRQQAVLLKALQAVVSAQIEENAASMQAARDTTACSALAAEEAAMKGRHSNHVKALREATEKKAAAVAKAKVLKDECTAVLRRQAVPPEDMTHFNTLPLVVEDVEEQLANAKIAKEMSMVDDSVMKQWERLAQSIESLEAQISDMTAEHEADRKRVVQGAEEWQHSVNSIVSRINTQFQSSLAKLKIAGEIKLRANVDDLREADIQVKVAFRAGEEPRQLGKDAHSGGERALTTMMYLLAMQHVTPLPFRVVDEINQGMDVSNERAVLETLLSDSAAASSSSSAGGKRNRQLFMITPKLLPDLVHSSAIRTEIVFNGPAAAPSLKAATGEAMHFLTRSAYAAIDRRSTKSISALLSLAEKEGNLTQFFTQAMHDVDAAPAPAAAATGGAVSGAKRPRGGDGAGAATAAAAAGPIPKRRRLDAPADDEDAVMPGQIGGLVDDE